MGNGEWRWIREDERGGVGRRTDAVEAKTVPESTGRYIADVDEVEDGIDVALLL